MRQRKKRDALREVMSQLGSVKSKKKAMTARENGKKGGRPPKAK